MVRNRNASINRHQLDKYPISANLLECCDQTRLTWSDRVCVCGPETCVNGCALIKFHIEIYKYVMHYNCHIITLKLSSSTYQNFPVFVKQR